MTLAVIDYGMGNLYSLERALDRLGAAHRRATTPGEAAEAERLILPGVGSAAPAMARLRAGGWPEFLTDWTTVGKPLLGICLGFQLLFESSEENGGTAGLGLLPGRVIRFRGAVKVPHMGWNDCHPAPAARLFAGLDPADFYFVHSYHADGVPADHQEATCDYGGEFIAAASAPGRPLFGVQFHPEKSGPAGATLLSNFIRMNSGHRGAEKQR